MAALRISQFSREADGRGEGGEWGGVGAGDVHEKTHGREKRSK